MFVSFKLCYFVMVRSYPLKVLAEFSSALLPELSLRQPVPSLGGLLPCFPGFFFRVKVAVL